MSDIVVIGSVNADFVVGVSRPPTAGETVAGTSLKLFSGGKGANQAYAAARLGASVAMIGRVGDDAYGPEQIRNLRSAGVATEGIRQLDGVSTGTAIVIVDEMAENRIIVVPGANGRFDRKEFAKDRSALRGARFALLQLETTMEATEAALADARRFGLITILDPAPARPLSSELLAQVDYLTPNLTELRTLAGGAPLEEGDESGIVNAARRLLAQGAGKLLVKRGPAGVMLVEKHFVSFCDAYKVQALDTTAAGDCFNAAFAAALCRGDHEGDAIDFACAAAALSVTRRGAQASIPTLAEVEEFRMRWRAEREAAAERAGLEGGAPLG